MTYRRQMNHLKWTFKAGDRVLCAGWPTVGEFVAVVDRPSSSGASYWVRSEQPIISKRTHVKGQVLRECYFGVVPADSVQPVSLLDDIAQTLKESQ